MSPQIPGDLRYARSHEWLRVENGAGTVGITDHAQHELTDVVYVELPDVGRQLVAGEACAVVESVKSAADMYAPVAGEVTEVNAALADNPALVNNDPYGEGWFFRMKLAGEADGLLDAAGYAAEIGAGES